MSRRRDHAYIASGDSLVAIFREAARKEKGESLLRSLPGYPWLDPCPRCGYRGSCDCTVFERAKAAHPGLVAEIGRAQ